MNEIKIPEAKLLRGLSVEDKLEIATRTLCDTAKEMELLHLRLLEMVDRLEDITRRVEAEFMAQAIRSKLHRRDEMDFTKGKHVWKKKRRNLSS